jgi:hypothetical protein
VVPQAVDEGFGDWEQVLVPLHVTFMQSVEVQTIVVPLHALLKQTSLNVHALPSLHSTDVRQAHVPPWFVQ